MDDRVALGVTFGEEHFGAASWGTGDERRDSWNWRTGWRSSRRDVAGQDRIAGEPEGVVSVDGLGRGHPWLGVGLAASADIGEDGRRSRVRCW